MPLTNPRRYLQRRTVLANARQGLLQQLSVIGDGPKESNFPVQTLISDCNRYRVPINIEADIVVKVIIVSSFGCTFSNAQHPEAPSCRASDHHGVSKIEA